MSRTGGGWLLLETNDWKTDLGLLAARLGDAAGRHRVDVVGWHDDCCWKRSRENQHVAHNTKLRAVSGMSDHTGLEVRKGVG